MIKISYHCTQQELYTVARLGWNSVTAYLEQFTAFKPKYVGTLVTLRLSEVDAAEALPDADQRAEDSKTLRVNLKNKAEECLGLWQKLKRYIIDAYPQGQQQIKLDAAGQAYYRKAAQDDWNAAKSLLNDGNSFITTNIADLTANGNMPPSFATTFATTKTAFESVSQGFFAAGQNDEIETQTKVITNNDVHSKLMTMFLDGREIFRGNEAVRKLFTFDQVLLTVSGPGIAGIRGLIKDILTGVPIGAGITVSLLNTDYSTTTNVNSRFVLSPVAAATYTVVVEKEGYQILQIPNVEIDVGVIKNLNTGLTSTVTPTQVQGTIRDAKTNAPVTGVAVTAYATTYATTSDVNGNYTLLVPVPGTYSIMFNKTGYYDLQAGGVVVTEGQTKQQDATITALP